MKFWLIFSICILCFGLGFFISNFSFTGKVIDNPQNYSYSTALCNQNKQCLDVLVFCSGNEILEIKPITELRDFSNLSDWKAPKSKEFCKN